MKYVYKIVAALGALAVIPIMFFSKLFYYKITSVALDAIMLILKLTNSSALDELLAQTGGKAIEAIGDSMSLYDVFQTTSSLSGLLSQSGSDSSAFDAIKAPLIVFAVVAILIVLCAVVTAVFAIVFKNNRKVIYSSITGIGLSLILKESFEAIAAPVLEGTVSLSTLTGSVWGDLIGNVEEFFLTNNFWFIPVVFGAVILWTVLYNYTLPDDEKRERKLMLGEADDQ